MNVLGSWKPAARALVVAMALAAAALAGAGLGGCVKKPEQLGEIPLDAILQFNGTVTWVDVEGGFWGILRDETDAKYRPVNLPKDYQLKGMRVLVTCRRVEGGITMFQWGQEVRIEAIESAPRKTE